MKHLSELLMPEDVRPVTSHLLYGETATRTERASQGINRSFSLTGHTNGETNSTFSPRVRLSWERERRAKIINAECEFQAARKNSCRRPRFPSATVRPATALLTDDEGNFERA